MHRRLSAGTLAVVAAALVLLTLAFSFVLSVRLAHDADLVLRSRADAVIETLKAGPDGLVADDAREEGQLDVSTWVYGSAGQVLESPSVRSTLTGAADALATVQERTFRDVGSDTRLLAEPVVLGGRRVGTVVVGLSVRSYHRAEQVVLVGALVLDGLVLALVAFWTRRVSVAALRPVVRMTEQAAQWSEQDPERRFGMGPPRDELTRLAATLDALLGRLAASLRHERALSADIAHELRTPLARVRAQAEIALRRPRSAQELQEVLAGIVASTEHLQSRVDALLTFAQEQSDPGRARCRVADGVAAAVTGSREGVELDVSLEQPDLLVGCSADAVGVMLAPLLDNAVRYARSRAWVDASAADGVVVLAVHDDGPGFRPEEAEHVFEPGARGSAGAAVPGTGLGLTLARRLARAAGGDVVVVAGPAGEVRLQLPGT
jgi:signal transduction histidine kinase